MKESSSTNNSVESEFTGLTNTPLKLKPYKIFSKSGNDRTLKNRKTKAHKNLKALMQVK